MISGSFRVGPIRPPSEAKSLLLQVTNGCTWNKCAFCDIYRHTKFKAYSADSVKEDIDRIAQIAGEVEAYRRAGGGMEPMREGWDIDGLNFRLGTIEGEEERQCFYMVANWLISGGETVFLQDGNTTALASGRLSDVLIYLKQTFPQVRRITSYGRAADLARHDADCFAELKAAGLDRIHSGFESGSDKVLELIHKGCTAEQEIKAGKAVKAGGIELSVYFMPGIGGKSLSKENAEGTAHVVNEVDPDFLRVRTAAVKPGTDLYEEYREGRYSLCGDDDKVQEIRRVIDLADGISTQIVSDHMVNLLQDVEGPMCPGAAKAGLLSRIDRYLEMPETDRRMFQLLRRTLRAYDLEDLANLSEAEMQSLREAVRKDPAEVWDEKMNRYICRYI